MGTSAFALSKQIRRRERSVREVVEETLVRMEAQEGEIHAFLDIEAEQALQKAEEVQEKLDAGETLSSLAGVPIAVKDNICIRGWKTTCASRILEGFRPPYTATAVERLKEAGVIPIGKTNMDEFAMGSTTETSYYGITRNPRRLA
ncbi:MAG TPA: Asp-tRNA(Asn)/Glu-tRNA(Gln) amidotransferase GatCAB subunit A, partial [Lachnospiraceae bacterium]|nr:Asp-tRNA(Asn)/Glu-tRNA(Gln) amidotransferase GatCAB subunit A [Lachnospiraceae bacterium]